MLNFKTKNFVYRYRKNFLKCYQLAGYTTSSNLKPLSDMPQPKGLPILGTFLDYQPKNFDPAYFYKFIQKRHENLGPIFKEKILIGTKPIVFTSSPNDVEAVFRNDTKFPNRPPFDPLVRGRELAGLHEGIVNAQGEEWYKLRKLFNDHLMTNKFIWMYTKEHLKIAFEFVDFIDKNKNTKNELPNFNSVIYLWALECATIFTLDVKLGAFTSDELSAEAKAVLDASKNILSNCSRVLYKPPFWKYFKNQDAKDLQNCVEEHSQALKIYMQMHAEESGLSEFVKKVNESNLNQIQRDSVLSDVLGSGVDTTSNAAGFLLYCLAINPEKQENLRNEIQEVLSSDKEFSGRALQQMKYLHAVMLESQRVYPLVSAMQRIITKDMELSGYLVPANTVVTLTANSINHKDPMYYEEPESFIPERWLDSEFKQKQKFVLTGSFGMGARMCPGRRFALQELGCLLVAILSRYKVEYHYEPLEPKVNLLLKLNKEPIFKFVSLEN